MAKPKKKLLLKKKKLFESNCVTVIINQKKIV